MAPALDPRLLTVIMVRPRYAENVGAVARLLANLGARELRLVAANEITRTGIAQRLARAGERYLEEARYFDTLDEARAGFDLTVATSHRGGRRRRPWTPWELTGALAELSPRSVALILGPEDSGLTRDEIDACHRLVSIPSETPLNVAQAALVLAYELCARPAPTGAAAAAERVDSDEGAIPRIVAAAEAALRRVGYPHHARPMQAEMAKLADLLRRAAPDRWETAFLIGMFRQIERGHYEGTDAPDL